MEEMIAVTATPILLNKDLAKATEKMFGLNKKIKEHLFEMCAIIADVDSRRLFEIDGFASVHEWTKKYFNFGQSHSYSMLKIGQEWTTTVVNKSGKVIGYTAKLHPDYSCSQLERLLPAGKELAEQLHAEGKVSPSMSAKQIQEVVKKAKEDEEQNENEELKENVESDVDLEEVTDTEPEEVEKPELLIRVMDENGTEYEIPESILMKYKC